MGKYLCIGCGHRSVKHPRTYCRCCIYRVRNGIAVDLEDVPTEEDCRKANAAMDAYAMTFATIH